MALSSKQSVKEFPDYMQHQPQGKEHNVFIAPDEMAVLAGRSYRYDYWGLITPYQDHFAFRLESGSELLAIPVHIAAAREFRTKIYDGLIGVDKPLTEHLSFPVKLGGKVHDFEVVNGPSFGGVVVVHVRGEQVELSDEFLHRYFPQASITKAGAMYVLSLPDQKPKYQSTTEKRQFGMCREIVTKVTGEKTTDAETTASLLTPQLRQTLEQYGDIVYESDPKGTDRLVIGIKSFPGRQGEYVYLSSFLPSAGDLYLKHRKAVVDLSNSIIKTVGIEQMRFFVESGFANWDNTNAETRRSLRAVMTYDKYFPIGASREEIMSLCRRLIPIEELSPEALVDVIMSFPNPMYNVLSRVCHEAGRMDILHGNGKPETGDRRSAYERMAPYYEKMQKIEKESGQEVASDVAALSKQTVQGVLSYKQSEMTAMIGELLQSNTVGMLLRAGPFFSSGHEVLYEDFNHNIPRAESYMRFLPNTQLVVVQVNGYRKMISRYKSMTKRVLESSQQHSFHDCAASMEILSSRFSDRLGMYIQETEPHKKSQWLMEILFCCGEFCKLKTQFDDFWTQ